MILKKGQYNFELFQRWMNVILLKQLIEQTWLTDQTKGRLNEISKIEKCFNSKKINQRKSCSKKLSKYVTPFKLHG